MPLVTCGGMLAVAVSVACRPPTDGAISGTVSVDGTPAAKGSIAFFPTDGKAPPAGGEITEGRYSARVAPGKARVEIRVPKVIGQRKLYDTPDSPFKQVLVESLPGKYNDQSELTVDVSPGDNTRDFDLRTD